MGAGASFEPPRPALELLAERDRARLAAGDASDQLVDLAEASPEALAAALACYIPSFVPSEQRLSAWPGADGAAAKLRAWLRQRHAPAGQGDGAVYDVATLAQATVEWHVAHYFSTPLVQRDPARKPSQDEVRLGEEILSDARGPLRLRRPSYARVPVWRRPSVPPSPQPPDWQPPAWYEAPGRLSRVEDRRASPSPEVPETIPEDDDGGFAGKRSVAAETETTATPGAWEAETGRSSPFSGTEHAWAQDLFHQCLIGAVVMKLAARGGV